MMYAHELSQQGQH